MFKAFQKRVRPRGVGDLKSSGCGPTPMLLGTRSGLGLPVKLASQYGLPLRATRGIEKDKRPEGSRESAMIALKATLEAAPGIHIHGTRPHCADVNRRRATGKKLHTTPATAAPAKNPQVIFYSFA